MDSLYIAPEALVNGILSGFTVLNAHIRRTIYENAGENANAKGAEYNGV